MLLKVFAHFLDDLTIQFCSVPPIFLSSFAHLGSHLSYHFQPEPTHHMNVDMNAGKRHNATLLCLT